MFNYLLFFICLGSLSFKVTSAEMDPSKSNSHRQLQSSHREPNGGHHADMDPFEKCLEIFKPQNVEMMCCENMVFGKEHWKSCEKKTGDDCSQPQCAFKKLGLMTPVNSMNETAVGAILGKLEKAMPNIKPMTQRVRMYCLEGQYYDYAPTDESCDAIKFLVCAYTNSMVECTMWKKTEGCMKLEHTTKECKAAIDGAV